MSFRLPSFSPPMTRRSWAKRRLYTAWRMENWLENRPKEERKMGNLFKIAFRNLLRYKRRTLLTASLVTIGVVFVLLFISISGSFKNMMVGQMTDSMLGHLEVHRKGYLASIDNLPLNLNLKLQVYQKLEGILKQEPEVEEGQCRRYGSHYCHKQGWFCEWETIQGWGRPRKHHRTRRERWLYPS